MANDHDLMLAVQKGDIEKLGILFEHHHKHLYNFFLQQTSDYQASEDLVQDVFYRMLKYRHSYRAVGKFTTWMFSIAHNVKVDYYRKNKRKLETIKESNQIVSTEPNPAEESEKRNDVMLLKKALNQLSDEKREVLLLSRFQNMKYEEISKVMGCQVGTIKARVHWALKDLTLIYHQLAGGESI